MIGLFAIYLGLDILFAMFARMRRFRIYPALHPLRYGRVMGCLTLRRGCFLSWDWPAGNKELFEPDLTVLLKSMNGGAG